MVCVHLVPIVDKSLISNVVAIAPDFLARARVIRVEMTASLPLSNLIIIILVGGSKVNSIIWVH